MIEIDDKARSAITNARALLDTMLANGWDQVCITGEEGDYFIARTPGTPNPLIAPAAPVAAAPAPVAAAAVVPRSITAPHVGTVAWLAALGTSIAKDEVVARLAVLDTQVDVVAPEAGTVSAQTVQIGDLAEFATELVTLVA